MGILSRLLGGSDEPEEPEEEDDGPDPEELLQCRFNLTGKHDERRVKITYDDGTTEKLTYDTYDQHNGVRKFKTITDWHGTRTYRSRRGTHRNMYGVEYQYELVKEIVVENVRSFEIVRESTRTYPGTHEATLRRKDYEKLSEKYDVEICEDDE